MALACLFGQGAALPRNKRSDETDNSCFLVMDQAPIEPASYSEKLADLAARADGIHQHATTIKNLVSTNKLIWPKS